MLRPWVVKELESHKETIVVKQTSTLCGPHGWVNVRMSLNCSAHSRHLSKLTLSSFITQLTARHYGPSPHGNHRQPAACVYVMVRCVVVAGWLAAGGVLGRLRKKRGLMAGQSTHLPSWSRPPLPFGSEVKRKQKLRRKSKFKGKDFEH